MDKIAKSSNFFEIEEIESFVGLGKDGQSWDECGNNMIGERIKLVVLHQNGENKKELISQLKTLIGGLENNFEYFAS